MSAGVMGTMVPALLLMRHFIGAASGCVPDALQSTLAFVRSRGAVWRLAITVVSDIAQLERLAL